MMTAFVLNFNSEVSDLREKKCKNDRVWFSLIISLKELDKHGFICFFFPPSWSEYGVDSEEQDQRERNLLFSPYCIRVLTMIITCHSYFFDFYFHMMLITHIFITQNRQCLLLSNTINLYILLCAAYYVNLKQTRASKQREPCLR